VAEARCPSIASIGGKAMSGPRKQNAPEKAGGVLARLRIQRENR
jgi:hypothetical protein